MTKFIFILISVSFIEFICTPIFGQKKSELDSLLGALKVHTEEDSTRVKILAQLCWQNRNIDFVKAMDYGKTAIKLAEKIKYYAGWAETLNFMGVVQRNMGDYIESTNLYLEALKISERYGITLQIAYSNNNMGDILKFQRKNDEALTYTLKALEQFKKLKDQRGMGYAYVRLGEIYQSQKKYDESIDAFQKALEIRQGLSDKSALITSYNRIGTVYSFKKDYTMANLFYEKGLSISEELNDKRSIAGCLDNLAWVNLRRGEYKQAKEKIDKAFAIVKDIKATVDEKNLYSTYSKYYESTGDFPQALDYYKKFKNLNDSLDNLEKSTQASKMQAIYDIQKKDQENFVLKKENEIHERDITQKNLILILVSIAFILSIGLIYLVLKSQREQKKLSKAVKKQNDEIKSSISYAQRIQMAMLPREDKINKSFDDFFILNLPRDIVSGDFYWFTETDEKVILAVVDCTGHGVPGALMSMVGNQLLTEIVIDREITEADIILNELHKGIRVALRQYENENRDGMDVSLVVIHKGLDKYQKIEFAGAQNPMFYIQNNDLTVIKGTKMSIGGEQLEKDRIFQKKEVDVLQESVFYLFSDGYQDQFGGEKNKKFMVKKFKNLLTEIHQLPMKEQQALLFQKIKDWKGKNDQTDDILVLGVRLS